MSNCICCSNKLLRHIRNHQVVLFCRNCWQEMPATNPKRAYSLSMSVPSHIGIKEFIATH
ncbi:hypothetical protein H6G54_13875 [Anabaena cylindrica FACHB-243]|uniref:Uncharacterized protein n=1 Tax=Anabaena cylindrica (strain ATCC 27899 / PCC 7122) TaxID=272123 RepID=K9ZMM3_ANACC|nr:MULTISPECIES: hypothetical protein [Anabaena]AFZ59570.1 hypothetical protein Anacy_4204 [Anabaena cylindrica PCC 7122]MBD2418764.1 hypothetical protein [Anabaena cylindrica FACHB-243]MBY5284750.1 hypothetical protein [Anabaena sp. CCAP 1446/1C]MBY5310860.1 hypothetical protein [Anabaena sp. CCAP 1446/1C]MCM2406329.1 hypothetical protein [Anabaena sp. CCAP 1446/1C]